MKTASDGRRVAVLGGGFSGLTVANHLHQNGFDVQVYEAQERWGGLAQSFRKNGFLYDFGPHYITNRLAGDLGILDECVHVPYAEDIHTAGRFFAFPFGLMRNPLFAAQAGLGMLRSGRARSDCTTAAEFFEVCYGRALKDRILGPLVQKWSGVPVEELSVDFVDRVPPPSLGVLLRKLLGVVTRRSIQTMPNQGIVYHVSPREGIQRLSDVLAAPLAERVSLSTPIEKVFVEDGKVAGVQVRGRREACDVVVSTLPTPVLPHLVEGTEQLATLARLRFRPVILAFLEVRRPRVLHKLLTWFPDAEQTFYRLSEQKIANPETAPADETLLTVEITCGEEEPLWRLPDGELRTRLAREIGAVYGIPAADFGEIEVRRTRFGYPMYDMANEEVRKTLELEARGGNVEGLYMVGRSGSFQYILLEEAHNRALALAREISGSPC